MNGLTRINNEELATVIGGNELLDIGQFLLDIGSDFYNFASDNGAFDSPFWSDSQLIGSVIYSVVLVSALIFSQIGSELGLTSIGTGNFT